MFDTIVFNLKRADGNDIETNYLDTIPQYLDSPPKPIKNGLRGYIGNLKVSIYADQIFIEGSLSRWWLKQNIHTLTRKDTEEAIKELSNILGCDIANARVYRIDVATNLIVEHSPELYLKHLGYMPKYFRDVVRNTTLYFRGGKMNTLCFYDKVKEVQRKRQEVDGVYKGANVLRYELRLEKRVARQLKLGELRARDLYDSCVYQRIIELYKEKFNSIHKKPQTLYLPDYTNVQELKQSSVLYLINKGYGGYEHIIEEIEIKRRKGVISNANAKRLKDYAREVSMIKVGKVRRSEKDSIIKELATKLESVCMYCR